MAATSPPRLPRIASPVIRRMRRVRIAAAATAA